MLTLSFCILLTLLDQPTFSVCTKAGLMSAAKANHPTNDDDECHCGRLVWLHHSRLHTGHTPCSASSSVLFLHILPSLRFCVQMVSFLADEPFPLRCSLFNWSTSSSRMLQGAVQVAAPSVSCNKSQAALAGPVNYHLPSHQLQASHGSHKVLITHANCACLGWAGLALSHIYEPQILLLPTLFVQTVSLIKLGYLAACLMSGWLEG